MLIVTSEFPPLPGGIGNHSLNLANSLTNKNYKVSVLTDCRNVGNKDLIFDNSLSFNVIRTLLKKNRKFMYFKRVQQLFSLARKNDIIIASGKFSLLIVGLLSFFYNRKLIAIVHGTEVNLNSNFLIRGLRNPSDFEFEKSIALTNRKISDIETVFFLTSVENSYISSSIVRELIRNKGDYQLFIPKGITI